MINVFQRRSDVIIVHSAGPPVTVALPKAGTEEVEQIVKRLTGISTAI